jgi:hypothetical protein
LIAGEGIPMTREEFIKTCAGGFPVYTGHDGWSYAKCGDAFTNRAYMSGLYREGRPGDEATWWRLHLEALAAQSRQVPLVYKDQESRDREVAAIYEQQEECRYELLRLDAAEKLRRGGLMMTDDVRKCLQARAEVLPWTWRRRIKTLLTAISAWRTGRRQDAPHMGIKRAEVVRWLLLQLDYARSRAREELCLPRAPKSTTPSTPSAAAAAAPPP